MTKLIATLVAVSTLGFASAAFAGTPVQLTDIQLDTVTAGAHAHATAGGFASGGRSATSVSATVTAEGRLHINGLATADGAVGIAVNYSAATGAHSVAASFASSSASSH